MNSLPRLRAALSVLVLSTATFLVATPAQAWDLFGAKTVAGSGRVVTQQRQLASFHKLSVRLPGTVLLVQGGTESVTVEADEQHAALVETVVEAGRLSIRVAKGYQLPSHSRVRVTVNLRNVDSLAVDGSGDLSAARLQSAKLEGSIAGSGSITIKDLQSDDLSVSIAGSGDFEAQGAAASMDVSIAGSGGVRTSKLATQKTSISIAGSGDASVWVQKSLSVSIAGSGDVRYYGEGVLQDSSVAGSGRVKQLAAKPPGV